MKISVSFTQSTGLSFSDQPGSKSLSEQYRARGRLSFTGRVERVWDDGFALSTGDRILRVDSWDLYGDFTRRYVSVNDQLTVSGEFDDGEFDAFSIAIGGNGGGNGGGNNPGGSDPTLGNSGDNVLRGTNGSDDFWGQGGRDRLIGLGGGDDLFGGAGNDTLIGGAGNDDLLGGAGDDLLQGGSGQDDLIGGVGRDILIGGSGLDTFILQPRGNDIIRDFQDGVDELGLSGGLQFNDLVFQQQGNHTLILAGGNRVALLLGVNASAITPADLG